MGAPPSYRASSATLRDRIAILCHTHPSLTKGGAEIAAYTLFRALNASGADAILVTACPEQDRARLALGSAREHAIWYEPGRYDPFYHLAPAVVSQSLQALFDMERVGVANFHHFLRFGLGALRDVARMGVQTVTTVHDYLPICHNDGQMVTRPDKRLCRRASPSACMGCFPERSLQQFAIRRDHVAEALASNSGLISPSHVLAERLIAWGVDADRLKVIENGLSAAPRSPMRRLRKPGQPWVFGFFGQITQFKGVGTLLRAAEAIGARPGLSDCLHLRIHGPLVGQSDAFLERFEAAVNVSPHLRYAGAYDNADVAELMADCDYVLVPSDWWENSPVVIQEAYAAGRPVICSDIGGMAEKVRDGVSGLHFRVGDAVDLVRVMEQAANGELFDRLCRGLPATIDGADMARQYLEAFSEFRRHA